MSARLHQEHNRRRTAELSIDQHLGGGRPSLDAHSRVLDRNARKPNLGELIDRDHADARHNGDGRQDQERPAQPESGFWRDARRLLQTTLSGLGFRRERQKWVDLGSSRTGHRRS